jgi:hypothetical protein
MKGMVILICFDKESRVQNKLGELIQWHYSLFTFRAPRTLVHLLPPQPSVILSKFPSGKREREEKITRSKYIK